MVELVCLDFLVEVVVLVEGCWWVWIFDSFGFFGGGCGCVKGYWWWRLCYGFLSLPLVVVELGFGVAWYWCVKWVSRKRDVNGY